MVEAGVIIGTTCLIERVQSITHNFSGRISWKRREEKGRAKEAVGTTGYAETVRYGLALSQTVALRTQLYSEISGSAGPRFQSCNIKKSVN